MLIWYYAGMAECEGSVMFFLPYIHTEGCVPQEAFQEASCHVPKHSSSQIFIQPIKCLTCTQTQTKRLNKHTVQ